jgi:hypothetical protein
MNTLELENAFPTSHFHMAEAFQWIGKEIYLKPFQRYGLVKEVKRTEEGYDLLIFCDTFSLLLSKPYFAKWVELKTNQVYLPVIH